MFSGVLLWRFKTCVARSPTKLRGSCGDLGLLHCWRGDHNSETGIGGFKTYQTLEGGGNSPRKLPLEDLDF